METAPLDELQASSPRGTREEMDELKDHIRENGLLSPLTVFGDKVTDGNRRVHALKEIRQENEREFLDICPKTRVPIQRTSMDLPVMV